MLARSLVAAVAAAVVAVVLAARAFGGRRVDEDVLRECADDVARDMGRGFMLAGIYANALMVALSAKGVRVQKAGSHEVTYRGKVVGHVENPNMLLCDGGRTPVEVGVYREAQMSPVWLRMTGSRKGYVVNMLCGVGLNSSVKTLVA